MNQVAVVHVLNSHKGLVPELEGFNLVKPLKLVKIVEEIAVFGVVQHKVDKLALFEHIMELDDVLVLHSTVDEYLFPKVFFVDISEVCYSVNL